MRGQEMGVDAMTRYLAENDAKSALRGGRAIEQLLEGRLEAGLQIVRFVTIAHEATGENSVTLHEVFNGGNFDVLDVYEFSPLDPDRSYGQVDSFRTVDDAFQFACEQTGADPRKFVNAGVVQDECRDACLTDA